MQTINYICDLCKKSVGQKDLSQISVSTTGINVTASNNRYNSTIKVDICKDCLKGKGIVVKSKEEEYTDSEINQNRTTLQDKIIGILSDLNVQFQE